ncbi:MAG: hypothetical protein ACD_41C00257G0003 [uncultured bacterium]|nr:MAG: hypothetical protein ACD_41C00257G0003 [uncultured bacterium]HBY74100.1 hypothetical protein [Candidatus Kerfeldbacteria bacterium]
MNLIFFGRGPVAAPSLRLLQQQSWCTLVSMPAPADVGVVIDFGSIIPQAVIDHFPHGIVNLHPSLLPRWRGPSPIKSALLHGDVETGVSLMVIDTGIDTGPILAQKTVAIDSTETNTELEQRLATIGAELLIEILPQYVAGQIKPQPQSAHGMTMSKLIQRQNGELTTQLSSEEMWNRYRAFQPWPGIYFMHQAKRYKITKAHWQADHLMCDEIQPEGKRGMTLAEFKRGYPAVSFADIV